MAKLEKAASEKSFKTPRACKVSTRFMSHYIPPYLLFFISYCIMQHRAHYFSMQVSEWEPWSQCTLPCGGGKSNRHRAVFQHPKYGGKECPPLTQDRSCNVFACCFPNCPPDVNVRVTNDTSWFPPAGCSCVRSESCDMKALMIRGPPETWPAQGGSHMWCHTNKKPACAHGWAWCSRKVHTQDRRGSPWGPGKDPDQWPPERNTEARLVQRDLKDSLPTGATGAKTEELITEVVLT